MVAPTGLPFREPPVEILGAANLQHLERHPQGPGRPAGTRDLRSIAGIGRVREDGDPGRCRDGLLQQAKRFALSSGESWLRPVMLLPGRVRLATSRVATGSPTPNMTIGIVLVACWAACAAG